MNRMVKDILLGTARGQHWGKSPSFVRLGLSHRPQSLRDLTPVKIVMSASLNLEKSEGER